MSLYAINVVRLVSKYIIMYQFIAAIRVDAKRQT